MAWRRIRCSRQRNRHFWESTLISVSIFISIQSAIVLGGNCTGNQRTSTEDTRMTYQIGVLYTVKEGTIRRPAYYLGAIPYAIKEINNNLLCHEPFKLDFWAEDTMGDVKKSLRTMTTKMNHTIAFVGPEKECYVEAYYAAAWNKPLITYNCQDDSLSDQSIFTSFARTILSTSNISKYVIALLKSFKWTRIVLIYQDKTKWRGAAAALLKDCDEHKIDVQDEVSFPENYVPDGPPQSQLPSGTTMETILMNTFKMTRVYVFFGEYDALIDFVRKMFLHGFVNGEYVVIALKDDSQKSTEHHKYYAHINDPKSLEWDMVEPMKVVLLLQQVRHSDDRYVRFINQSAQHAMDEPFKVPFLGSDVYTVDYTKLTTAVYAAYLYDAINLLALAIQETREANENVYNGTQITTRIKRKPYYSILGYQVNEQGGEPQHIYQVYSLKTDKTAPLGKSIQPVGNFSKPGPNGLPTFFEYPDSPIEWIGDHPPLNEPKCGFDGSTCHWPIVISCVVAASVFIIVFVFGCRHYIYEQKLSRLLWRIEYSDLLMAEPDTDPSLSEKLKHKQYSRFSYCTSFSKGGSIMNDPAMMSKSSFLTIASYKNTLVVVKGYRKRHIEMNRDVKKELYYLREMSNDNINRLIGACLDQPTVCVVTQYCARGSLKDILENDDLPLDEMFTASLIFDLIKGMIYLHDSEVVSHGNLKPSNCLVDSRWVLQIADYGLCFLKSDIPAKSRNSEAQLYRAPEFLRMPCPPPQGSQKGDVYSFAIILHEIHSRSGPWGNCAASVSEILERVISKPADPDSPIRPDISSLKCDEATSRCMQECWGEDPDSRPDFKYVRVRLKPMQRGLRSNIFDNMLAIMEKYATTLEAIVEERTNQLMEEKKKTEALLLRMLPKSVADQLKRGEFVEPEQFECVTIYFSDIVGFTSLSAESTPLQVVTLLNDLYTMFDSIIGEYDVYKVETIGDAYMVVSGLPIRNNSNHAGEVASMSLHLLSAIQDFKIRHQPDETLKLRIGMHSGPCVTGVVGMKMPRYCLFGDTVNTASRMETTGVPLKIHCSPQTKEILDKLGGYHLEERGFVLVKGKGEVFTYFLTGEDITHRQRRISLLRKERKTNNNLLQLNNYNSLSGSTLSLFEIENDCSYSLRVPNGRMTTSNLRRGLSVSGESMV